jgi:hypothetical protein
MSNDGKDDAKARRSKRKAEPQPGYRRDDFLRDLRKVARRLERDRDEPSQDSTKAR